MRDLGMTEAVLPMLEMPVPEYFVTDIGRIEEASRDSLRFYCCAKKGKTLEPQYSVVVPIEELVSIARLCMQAAGHQHNRLMMALLPPKVAH